jgi:hypothetical protein
MFICKLVSTVPQIVFWMDTIEETLNSCVCFVGQPHENKTNLEKMDVDMMIWNTVCCDSEETISRN